MRVRMKVNITGYRNLEPWPAIGETIDLPDGEADSMIQNGYAEACDEAPTADSDEPAASEDGDQADTADSDEPAASEDGKPKRGRK